MHATIITVTVSFVSADDVPVSKLKDQSHPSHRNVIVQWVWEPLLLPVYCSHCITDPIRAVYEEHCII